MRSGPARVGRVGSRFAGLVAFVAVLGLPSAPVSGQESVEAVLHGRVLLGEEPLPGVTVVVHRVSPESAGELDSLPSGPDGEFRYRLPHMPDPGDRSEVFLASVRHLGILYFGPPITAPVQLDSLYTIQAFDTASAPVGGATLPVRVRNLFFEPDGDEWQVTDLFQVGNDGDRTLVARPDDATWMYPLPEGARNFELGQGDLSSEQVSFEDGAVRVRSPLTPGDRLLVFRYRLESLTAAVPMPGVTERAELLVREPAPPLEVSGLAAQDAVELERGTSYRRYLGDGLRDVVTRVTPVDPPSRFPVEWLAVLMGLFLAAVAIIALKRPRPAVAVSDPVLERADERRRLLLEIARLDEAHARSDPGSEGYQARRDALLARLSEIGPV